MKTYISKQQVRAYSQSVKDILTEDTIKTLKELGKKYGLEFNHKREINLRLFFLKVVAEIDALPKNDPFKATFQIAGLRWDNEDHTNSVKSDLMPTVNRYMVNKGYIEDYKKLASLDTSRLQDLLDYWHSKDNIPRIQIEEVMSAYPNINKIFEKFTKDNVEQEALDYTSKIINIIEDMYQGEFMTVLKVYDQYKYMRVQGQSQDEIFQSINTLLHK